MGLLNIISIYKGGHPMNDCIFCKIIAGDIPSATIYENDEFKVILDRFPSGEGHALILPKNHVANIFEIDPEQAGRLFALAAKLAKAMKEVLGFEHMNILQNNGPAAGQSVFHLHFHVLGGKKLSENITHKIHPIKIYN